MAGREIEARHAVVEHEAEVVDNQVRAVHPTLRGGDGNERAITIDGDDIRRVGRVGVASAELGAISLLPNLLGALRRRRRRESSRSRC